MFSVLSKDGIKNQKIEKPAFFEDLNINQIIKLVSADWEEEIEDMFYNLPSDKEEEDYRRAVFQDMKKESILAAFKKFQECMKQRTICMERKERVKDSLQKNIWYFREVGFYLDAVEGLIESLNTLPFSSEGLDGLKDFLKKYTESTYFKEIQEETAKLQKELSSFRLLLVYEKDRFSVSEGTGKGAYTDYLNEILPGPEKVLKSPFLASFDCSDFEQEAIHYFRRNHKDFFVRVENYNKHFSTYAQEDILLLQKEILYYIAYLQFIQKMQLKGMEFCTPNTQTDCLSTTGLYDLALACVNINSGKEVVSNDCDLFKEENFFVVTGPNQGGKTTFARSLGQLVFFTKMGLDVPAKSASVPYYQTILSHFSVEESSDSGRGKLVDELMRLQPMMSEEQTNAFIIINELFTTAANYDACIMGKQVLEYFIEKHCKGIYVTHLNELSKAHPSVVSLQAAVDDNLNQTYKIKRHEASEFAGANRQVEKYRLTYKQIKERFV